MGTVTMAGTIAHSRGLSSERWRVLGQWALVYLAAGCGSFQDERGYRIHVTAGDWILVFPEIGHRYAPEPDGLWHEIYVCFEGPIFENWRTAGYFDPRQPTGKWLPPADGVARFATFFRQAGRRGCSALEVLTLWQTVLAEIFHAKARTDFTQLPWLRSAIELLESPGSRSDHQLRDIAARCNLSYESFRKKFEQSVGVPPGRYALERKIERARQLIRMSRLTNKELAESLGFCDEFHFSRTFSKLTGMSPGDFRRQYEMAAF